MSWPRVYRLALGLLPAALRRKHGRAMEDLFTRDVERARAHGWLHGALTGAAGVWDVVCRGLYEQVRPTYFEGRDRQPALARDSVGGAQIPQPTASQLLRRHAASFAIAFVALTASLLAIFARRQIPSGTSAGTITTLILYAVPFTAALTIPMAVFIAALWEFSRLRLSGTLAAARQERAGVRRLVVPVLRAAAGVAVLAFVVTAEIVPRANARLTEELVGSAAAPNPRTMTIGELQSAARTVRPGTGSPDLARVTVYEVEIQKKIALPAACLVMALAGMAIALNVPRGGVGLMIGASCLVFGAYYLLIMTGESLAARLVISPVIGMWGADALLCAPALLAVWRSCAPRRANGGGPIVARG